MGEVIRLSLFSITTVLVGGFFDYNKALSFIQNISKYWLSTSVLNKERIQKLLFPQGLTLDVEKRQYLTSEVNTLFMLKLDLMGLTEEDKKKLPIVYDGESNLVDKAGNLSNLIIIQDVAKVIDFIDNTYLEECDF